MNAGGRLALYAAGLAVAFGGAFAAAAALAPDDPAAQPEETAHGGDDHGEDDQQTASHTVNGTSISAEGFVLSPVEAPTTPGTEGELSFQITTEAGEPVTEYTTAHEKDLHLIVVRTDGAQFRHVHPELDLATGTWSIPWTWDEPGTYRVYTDFTPAAEGASALTLTRTIDVAGTVTPIEHTVQRTDEVDGFTVSIDGDLVAGSSSELTISIEDDGGAVTTLEPYLGAFGHLVALREGDLAYLHVHAEGTEPAAGDLAGPEIVFAAHAPTAGRYLLYLDFQVDGEVHTAEFVLDAAHGDDTTDNDDH